MATESTLDQAYQTVSCAISRFSNMARTHYGEKIVEIMAQEKAADDALLLLYNEAR